MTRNLTASLETAIVGDFVEVFFAIEAFFDGGTLRLWTGNGTKSIEGNSYTGAGEILGIAPVKESSDLSANSVSVTLTGIDSSIVSLALSEDYSYRDFKLYFGVVTSGGSFVMDQIFQGYMSTMSINEQGETCDITLVVENKMLTLQTPRLRRYTNNDQQNEFPGDLGLEFVEDLQRKEIVWGRK